MKLSRHPLSALFSAYDLQGDELKSLANSIRDNGQLHPITLWQGSIVDGWNRYQACAVYGLEPITQELAANTDPWEYVKAQNMARRHMTPGERVAVLALKLQMEGGVPNGTALSINEVRKEIDVGRGTAERAAKIIKAADPEINQALSEKRISLDKAAKVAELPKAERKAAIEAAPEPHRKPEKAPEPEPATDALDEANDRAHDLAIELEAYMKAAEGNDESAKEILRLNRLVETITANRDEYMTKCNELIRQVKSEQAKVKRLEDKVKSLENTSSGGF